MPATEADLNSIDIHTLKGEAVSLGAYATDVKLIVNVASRCGLAPQYEQPEGLQFTYGQRRSTTWRGRLPDVRAHPGQGRTRHPLCKPLTTFPYVNRKAGRIKWNFEKFVVTPGGKVSLFLPTFKPDDPEIIPAIEAGLDSRAV